MTSFQTYSRRHLREPDVRTTSVDELFSADGRSEDEPLTGRMIVVKDDLRRGVHHVHLRTGERPRAEDERTFLPVVRVEGDVDLAGCLEDPGRLPADVTVSRDDRAVLDEVRELVLDAVDVPVVTETCFEEEKLLRYDCGSQIKLIKILTIRYFQFTPES